MMNRTLSVIALISLAGAATLAVAPTAAAGPFPCATAEAAIDNTKYWFTGTTAAELVAWLAAMDCPNEAISAALCYEFGFPYCFAHDVLSTDIDHLVKPIYDGDHVIKAAGVTVVGSGKGVQYKDGCGTNLERQMNCRTAAPALPAFPTPSVPAQPPVALPGFVVESPITMTVAVGDIVIVWPSQIPLTPCEYWPGDANCS